MKRGRLGYWDWKLRVNKGRLRHQEGVERKRLGHWEGVERRRLGHWEGVERERWRDWEGLERGRVGRLEGLDRGRLRHWERISIAVFILKYAAGSSQYDTTRKNTQRYYTPKRQIRHNFSGELRRYTKNCHLWVSMHTAALISFKKGAHAILRMRQTGVLKRQNRKIGNAQKNCTDGVIFLQLQRDLWRYYNI